MSTAITALFLSAASGDADIVVRISVRSSVRPSVCPVFLTTFPNSDHHEIAYVYASLKN